MTSLLLHPADLLRSRTIPLAERNPWRAVAELALLVVVFGLAYGAVIDFIDIQGIPRWNYIFNTADVAIHVGLWPLAIGTLVSPTGGHRAPPQGRGGVL